jgi:branched-chain amino acid transport system ATP-binding protein
MHTSEGNIVTESAPLLLAKDIRIEYDGVPAVHSANVAVYEGTLVGLVGANGAGKSSLLRCVAGDLPPMNGQVFFHGQDITATTSYARVDIGFAHVPEGRRLFGSLTVSENLRLGAFKRSARKRFDVRLQKVVEMFPILGDRLGQPAETLSGGEQQMLALARGLMSDPQILLVDELSLGIMPTVVDQLYELISDLTRAGTSVLMADQNTRRLLEIADHAYVMQSGSVVMEDSGANLANSDEIKRAYLGM